jgi:N-acetylneuraminic acid mutarotase
MRRGTAPKRRANATAIGAFLLLFLVLATLVNSVHSSGDHWTTKKPVPSARTYAGATSLNRIIYLIGGIDISLHILSTNDAYDPVSDTWTSLAPLPFPTDLAGVVSVDGLVYSIGGFSRFGDRDNHMTGAVEAYDPQSNNWTSRTPLPLPAQGLMAAAVNGLIYAMGGFYYAVGDPRSGNQDSTWVYNPHNDTWRPRAAMPTYNSSLAQIPDQVAVVNGKIYVFDQTEGSLGPGRPNDPKPMFNLVYDPATDTWAHWPALLEVGARGNPISLGGDSMVALGTKILVIGGNDIGLECTGKCSVNPVPSPVNQYNFEYDTVTGSWTRRTDMPTGRVGVVTANVDGIVYAMDGTTSNPAPLTTGYTDHNEAYTPCLGFCPAFYPNPSPPYLSWAVDATAALGVVGIGVILWRSWREHKRRPPIRPLDPLDWRSENRRPADS